MKKKFLFLFLAISCAFSIGLCGCGIGASDQASDTQEEEKDEDTDKDGDEDEENEVIPFTEIDYSSEKSLMSFLKGRWDLVDLNSGTSYGKLEIDRKGNCTFSRSDVKTCNGTFALCEHPEGNIEGYHFYSLELSGLEETFDCWTDTDSSNGRFMISQKSGKDFLYMEEIGNGGSSLAYQVLISPYNEVNPENIMQWVFVRDNDVNVFGDPVTDSEFYAMCVEVSEDGLCLQQLDPVTFEETNEYTNFKFMAAEFDESAYTGAAEYVLSEDADMTGVLYESKITRSFPLPVYPASVYHVKTDSDGNIVSLDELCNKYYGEYELYSLEQVVETDGKTFSINGQVFDPENYGVEAGNAILDVNTFGDDLIITSHLNPHMGIYTIFNMRSAWPVHEIYGCNLLYDDHIWDSFYSYMDTVYDYNDSVVCKIDGEEICGLSFTDNGKKIKIEYWKKDYKDVYEMIIDRPECLNAPIYAFADFCHNRTPESFREFLSYAPDDATFMVMVNPHSDDAWDFHQPIVVEGGGEDLVYVVSLTECTDYGISGTDSVTLNKGEIQAYNITVSEGASLNSLVAIRPDGKVTGWIVSVISGKDDTRWIFM